MLKELSLNNLTGFKLRNTFLFNCKLINNNHLTMLCKIYSMSIYINTSNDRFIYFPNQNCA